MAAIVAFIAHGSSSSSSSGFDGLEHVDGAARHQRHPADHWQNHNLQLKSMLNERWSRTGSINQPPIVNSNCQFKLSIQIVNSINPNDSESRDPEIYPGPSRRIPVAFPSGNRFTNNAPTQ